MQDLGLARRDHVSAPEADAKGRTMRDDPRQSRAIMAEFETRRNQAADTSSTEDARAERLRAWNSKREHLGYPTITLLTLSQLRPRSNATRSLISWRTGSADRVIAPRYPLHASTTSAGRRPKTVSARSVVFTSKRELLRVRITSPLPHHVPAKTASATTCSALLLEASQAATAAMQSVAVSSLLARPTRTARRHRARSALFATHQVVSAQSSLRQVHAPPRSQRREPLHQRCQLSAELSLRRVLARPRSQRQDPQPQPHLGQSLPPLRLDLVQPRP